MAIKIDKKLIRKLADLAYIELTDNEVEQYTKEIDGLLEYVNKIQSVDTSGIEYKSQTSLSNVFREDEPGESLDQKTALLNRKENSKDGYFTVKSVIKK